MNPARTSARLGVLTTLLLLGACSRQYVRVAEGRDCGPPAPWPPLPSLGHDAAPFELQRSPEDPRPGQVKKLYTYRFERETSGTEETLRAVVKGYESPPLIVGDRGVVLVRDPANGWQREPTGTTEDLYAVAIMTVSGQGKSPPFLAVGAHGTALVRGPDGTWRAEATGTTADLYAVSHRGPMTIVAGAGGVMLTRSGAGVWRALPTRTRADLYAVGSCDGHLCAVGAAGALVDCTRDRDEIVCIPREPSVAVSLRAFVEPIHIVGDGVWLHPAQSQEREHPEPVRSFEPVSYAPLHPTDDLVRATAWNHLGSVSEILAVGARSRVWFLGNHALRSAPFERLQLPYAVDFHGVAYEFVDGFLVGDRGTIVKLGLHGITRSGICR